MKRVARAAADAPVTAARWYVRRVSEMRPAMGARFRSSLNDDRNASTDSVVHKSSRGRIDMVFHTPNEVCRYRATTFSTKEPETLQWIEEFGGHGAFYDIGANVGLYTIYHAKLFDTRVYAFEPSVLNLELLARNITLNTVTDRTVVVPIPLTTSNQVAPFRLSSLEEGGALSSFGVDYGHDGRPLDVRMQYDMLGMSLDFLVDAGVIPEPPSIIKLDVDGIEHLILRGAERVLSAPTLRSVLVEVDESFTELADEVAGLLRHAGLRFKEKRHGALFDTGEFAHTFNQVWVRD